MLNTKAGVKRKSKKSYQLKEELVQQVNIRGQNLALLKVQEKKAQH